MANNTVKIGRRKIPVSGARMRHDTKPNRVYIWLIGLFGIAAGLVIIIIIIHLIFRI